MAEEDAIRSSFYGPVFKSLADLGLARRTGTRQVRREIQLGETVSVAGLVGVYDGDGHVLIAVPDEG